MQIYNYIQIKRCIYLNKIEIFIYATKQSFLNILFHIRIPVRPAHCATIGQFGPAFNITNELQLATYIHQLILAQDMTLHQPIMAQ